MSNYAKRTYLADLHVAEVLVDRNRMMSRIGGSTFSTDLRQNEYKSYEALLKAVHNGAGQLNISTAGIIPNIDGQAGLFRIDRDQVVILTALHNVLSGPRFKPVHAMIGFSGPWTNIYFSVKIPALGQTSEEATSEVDIGIGLDGAVKKWEYGIDFTVGYLSDEDLSEVSNLGLHIFEPVPLNYIYAVGTKVAMAVFPKTAPDHFTAKVSSGHNVAQLEDLISIFGKTDEINVLVGSITGVEERFILYDINSYQGLSGAIVFAMDGEHAGKAIAVHVGSPKKMSHDLTNMGLKISYVSI